MLDRLGKERLAVIRRATGNALFVAGVAVLVAGSWLASAWWLLATCLIGGVVLFALAELIAPFPDRPKGRRVRDKEHGAKRSTLGRQ
jgi:hypothetical protein